MRVEGGLAVAASARAQSQDPVVEGMFARVVDDLVSADHFHGPVRDAFVEVLASLLCFLRYRYNIERSYAVPQTKYLFSPPEGTGKPLEEELAQDLYYHFVMVGISGMPHYEVRGIGTGRVDLLMTFGGFELSIEAKRELADASREGLRGYLNQAAAYTGAGVRLGFLVVLDLTPKPNGVEAFEALVWVEVVDGVTSTDLPRHIVVTKVPGNRQPPSDLSRPAARATRKREGPRPTHAG